MILIAVGANLPGANGASAIETCQWAVGQLSLVPGWRVRGLSRWYRTAPVPASDQPDYINGVAHVEGNTSPEHALAHLHRIEAEAGRVRGAANAARTLDLDLLAVDMEIRDTPTLTLPHPRMQDRGFVLYPLRDVAPAWRHPVLRATAAELLARLGLAGELA